MKIALLIASMLLLLLTSEVSRAESGDGPLMDALSEAENDMNEGEGSDDDSNTDRNDMDSGDGENTDTSSSDDPGSFSSILSPGSSSNDLLQSIAPTALRVVAVSILATYFLLLLMGHDFSSMSSLMGLPESSFAQTGYPAPNYPYEEFQEEYVPPPVILARRSYAALTPVIEAISSAYRKYQGYY